MLRTCLAAADIDGSVCVFLEPIALYHTRDLYEPGEASTPRWFESRSLVTLTSGTLAYSGGLKSCLQETCSSITMRKGNALYPACGVVSAVEFIAC
jgi:hypothetical protein